MRRCPRGSTSKLRRTLRAWSHPFSLWRQARSFASAMAPRRAAPASVAALRTSAHPPRQPSPLSRCRSGRFAPKPRCCPTASTRCETIARRRLLSTRRCRVVAPTSRRTHRSPDSHPHPPAARCREARRPPVLSAAAAAGEPAGRRVARRSRGSRFRFSSTASRICIRGTKRCWPTKWGWARRCRRSSRCGCWLTQGRVRRALVVCPKPLVTNWRREFAAVGARAAGDDRRGRPGAARVAVEPRRRRRAGRQLRAAGPRSRATSRPIGPPFDLVVVDEAQRIKNAASATHDAVLQHSAAAKLGAHRHADRKQRRRPGRHLRVRRRRAGCGRR